MKWLNKPYPLLEDIKTKVSLSFFIGLVCFVFLMVFQPFQLDEVKGDIGLYTMGLGMNAVLSMLIYFVLLPRLLPHYYNSYKWTIKHHLILMFCITSTISVFNFIYNSTIGRSIAPQHSLPMFIYITFTVGIFPVLIISYISEKLEKNKNISDANALKGKLSKVTAQKDIPISIMSSDAAPQSLQMKLSEFLYAQAQNNYTQVFFSSDHNVNSQLIRISLKDLQKQIDHPNILRCHKSFLVNKSNIDKIDGNSRSLFVQFRNSDKEVPVSRNFNRNLLLMSDAHS